MFIVDFVIIGFSILKASVLAIYCSTKKNWQLFFRLCQPFEIFLCIMLSHSIIGYIVCHNISSILNSREELVSTDLSRPITPDLGKIAIIKTTFERGLNFALVQMILCGPLVIHFSPHYELSCQPLPIQSHKQNTRRILLEKKGFLLSAKLPYIIEKVGGLT